MPAQSGEQASAWTHDCVVLLLINMQAKKSDLKAKACQLMDLKETDVRMWDYYAKDLYANMEDQLDDGVTGPGNALNDKQFVLLEEKV